MFTLRITDVFARSFNDQEIDRFLTFVVTLRLVTRKNRLITLNARVHTGRNPILPLILVTSFSLLYFPRTFAHAFPLSFIFPVDESAFSSYREPLLKIDCRFTRWCGMRGNQVKFHVREKERRELSFPLWTFFAVWPAKEEGRKLSFDRISARKTATPCETKSDLSLSLSSFANKTRQNFELCQTSRARLTDAQVYRDVEITTFEKSIQARTKGRVCGILRIIIPHEYRRERRRKSRKQLAKKN